MASQLVNPFVGLRAFEENEDYLFFGRSLQINELLKKFNDNRFLAVIGSSGSGKSSLVKSGLLPAIYSGFMTVGSNWRVALMQPGENPLRYLTKQLAEEGTLYQDVKDMELPLESIIESRLRRSEKGLMHVYEDAHLPANENLLIVVDQFEELFRFSKYEKDNKFGKSDAMHFIQILLTAAQQKEHPIYVLLTMRSDFLGDCAEFRGLPEAINNGQYLVPRMSRDEIREAITGPVAVNNATITQRLVTRLLNDINNDTDQLPVLQHAMMRTWDAWYKRNQHNTPIDFEDYDKIGTMKEALSIHADEAYSELKTEQEQNICALMFKALTDKSTDLRGVRRPRTISDLCQLTNASEAEITRQVEIFRKPGRTFLMPPHFVTLTTDSIIDISHESLMRVWDRLVKWAEEESRSGDIYLRLAASAVLNKLGERGALKDPELQIALRWRENNKPSVKWSEGFKADYELAIHYLDKSQADDIEEKKNLAILAEEKLAAEKHAAKRKLRNLIFVLMALLLIGAVISIINSNIQKAKVKDLNEELRKKNVALGILAQKSRDTAMMALVSAHEAEINATAARDTAEVAQELRRLADSSAKASSDSAAVANHLRKIADSNAVIANQLRIKADNNAEETKRQNLKNAPSEYARLIREGPLNKKKIERDTFDYKLLAYADHLDKLGPLIVGTNDNDAKDKYDKLIEKLYYNNDLYEKIYASLVNTTSSKNKVFGIENYSGRFPGEFDSSTNNKLKSEKVLSGINIIKLIKNEKDSLVFCSSDDHWLYIFKDDKKTLVLQSKIAMGAKVTALDYNSVKNIIYFGTEGGNIGYLLYGINKKNQPVFENALGSAITAIHFFQYKDSSFLLAGAKRSKVVVYLLDSENPEPDKKLMGNILPENILTEVDNAKFDGKRIIIKVRSTKNGKAIFYYWNPFARETLELYRKEKHNADYINRYKEAPVKIY